jgi:ATP-dependent Clp protease ATP-binding subunit ClpB
MVKMNDQNKDKIMDAMRIEVFDLLKKTIRPEFLNRIDELIMFTPLDRDDIRNIVLLQIKNLENSLKKNNINLKISGEALDLLADMGFDPQYGARPLKRVIQRNILNELSRRILAGSINQRKPIQLGAQNGQLVFHND